MLFSPLLYNIWSWFIRISSRWCTKHNFSISRFPLAVSCIYLVIMATLPTLSSVKSVCYFIFYISGFLICQVSCQAVFNATIWYYFSFAHDASVKTDVDTRGQSRCVVFSVWDLLFCHFAHTVCGAVIYTRCCCFLCFMWKVTLCDEDWYQAIRQQLRSHNNSSLTPHLHSHVHTCTHHHVHSDTTTVFQMKRLKRNSERLMLASQWRLWPGATT